MSGEKYSTQSVVDSSLEEIRIADPKVEWKIYIPDKQWGVVVSLPHDCFIVGTLTESDKGKMWMKIDMFQVNEALRGAGVGERLLRILADEAKQYGAGVLVGHVTSKAALATRKKVFGEEGMVFRSHVTGDIIARSYDEIMGEKGSDDTMSYDVASRIK